MSSERKSRLPVEFRSENDPYGFIGRDGALVELERAMHRSPAGILIQGACGIGKTTLARGFVRWLEDTKRLGQGALWLDFRAIHSAEHVLNRMGEVLLGPNFGPAPAEAKLDATVNALREHRFVIVWDNFESASGTAGTSITSNFADEDRALLARFLERMRDGATKILITSRSGEDWLGPQLSWKLPLGGFDGKERWEYCETILRDLGMTVNREDRDYAELMKQLDGHPLAIRVMLPQLEKCSAAEIVRALRGNLQELKLAAGAEAADKEASAQLLVALRFIEHALPEWLQPLLQPLSLHEAYVGLDYIETMAKLVPGDWSRAQIDQLMGALATAGLVGDLGQESYELHPALTAYLRSYSDGHAAESAGWDDWNRAFVHVMAVFADSLTSLPSHQQRGPFRLHGANFSAALAECERLAMVEEEKALTQSLAVWAQNSKNFVEAERLFLHLAQHEQMAAGAYHELGMLSLEQRDLTAAEQWYRKSLAIWEEQGNEHDASITYHQLGMVALERHDFVAAEQWYRKSLAISEKHGDENGAAITYHRLGWVEKQQSDLAAAEQWYRKSLAIREKRGNEVDTARN